MLRKQVPEQNYHLLSCPPRSHPPALYQFPDKRIKLPLLKSCLLNAATHWKHPAEEVCLGRSRRASSTWDSRGQRCPATFRGQTQGPTNPAHGHSHLLHPPSTHEKAGGGQAGGAGEGGTLRKPDTGDVGRGTQAPQTTQLGVSLPWEERPASHLGHSPGQHTGRWGPASLSSPTRAPAVHPCPPR